MKNQNSYFVIGCMSGTSLDGLDLCAAKYELEDGKWNYKIVAAETIKYTKAWQQKLSKCMQLPTENLIELHSELGIYFGKQIKLFVTKHKLKKIDFVASHGHTVFHNPKLGYTFQMGHGANIAKESGLKTVCDFRTTDVAYGGQGAPLVPIGDQLLFANYEACMNLGGIANISFIEKKKVIAFDISLCNILLNHITIRINKAYDNNGQLARKGMIDKTLLAQLNKPKYFNQPAPKSLGREFFNQHYAQLLNDSNLGVPDLLATAVEHISVQISKYIQQYKLKSLLITGGGALNSFLIDQLKVKNTDCQITIPNKQIIDFKEALIFGLLGVLRMREESNALASVTGAEKNSSGGCVYLP